ncbi:MAG: DUF485 domain-containing protein [Cytophagales bacterium]|nr:DUF485 domain-containing protein [Armatimonadota bacterium]
MTTAAARMDREDEQAKATLARAMMRRQAALGVRVAAVFLVLIFGLPLVNWLMPQVAGIRVGGFTLTWLLLGVLFYPITWLLSGYFIRESDKIEARIAAEYPHATTREAER